MPTILHENVSRDDSAIDIAKKVFRSSVMSLEDTAKLFDADDLDKAVQLLLDARRVSFYGSGESNAVAYDAYQKFLRSPIEVQFAADYHVQLMQASLLGKEDCIFAITHTGLSEGIINIARIAKDAGAKVIAVASYPSKYLEQYADVILLSSIRSTRPSCSASLAFRNPCTPLGLPSASPSWTTPRITCPSCRTVPSRRPVGRFLRADRRMRAGLHEQTPALRRDPGCLSPKAAGVVFPSLRGLPHRRGIGV